MWASMMAPSLPWKRSEPWVTRKVSSCISCHYIFRVLEVGSFFERAGDLPPGGERAGLGKGKRGRLTKEDGPGSVPGTYMWRRAGGSGRDGEFGGADAVV